MSDSQDTGWGDAKAARDAAWNNRMQQLRAEIADERRLRDANRRATDWADAKTGPLPMAHFLVRSWRRVTHTRHPSYLVLSALTAANEAIALRLPSPDAYPSLSAVQKLRLRLLRWLIGDKDTEDGASAPVDPAAAISPISAPISPGSAPASRPSHPMSSAAQRPIRPGRRSAPLSAQLHDPLAASPAAAQSPAISNDSHLTASQPPVAADAEPATTQAAAHRLCEDGE